MNSRPILVVPFEPRLMGHLRRSAVVIRIDAPEDIPEAVSCAHDCELDLRCIWVQSQAPLDMIRLDGAWENFPLAIQVPSLGKLSKTLSRIHALRRFNLRIDLPGESSENITHIRILSSLGIRTAFLFGEGRLNWDEAADLMTYAFLALAPHADIEPFMHTTSIYHPRQRTDFNAAYFDDGVKYLQVNARGGVARTRRDLLQNRFLAADVFSFLQSGGRQSSPPFGPTWQDFFLQADACSCCPGWRLCLGKFPTAAQNGAECSRFFEEFMDLVEQFQGVQKKKREPWLP